MPDLELRAVLAVAQADWVARGLAIGGIAVGLVSPFVTLGLWRRSGSRIEVSLKAVQLNANRLMDVVRVEVRAIGSQAVVVRKLELGVRVPGLVVNGTQQWTTDWFAELEPTDGLGPLRQTITPTDYLTSDVPIMDVAQRCGMDVNARLLARATRGDERTGTSRVVTVRTPAQAEFK